MRPRLDPSERFWSKVDKSGDCWLWTGAPNSAGYANFKVDGRIFLTHRWSYLNLVGEIPKGLVLDHLCRVRLCVNPAHLEAVTVAENTLRGQNIVAINARKTHCKHGHEFNEQNTRVNPQGKRVCRPCVRRRLREFYARQAS